MSGSWSPEPVFSRLREILIRQAGYCTVSQDAAQRFALQAPVGPATVKAWKGKVRSRVVPVAWVEVQKGYVSYHLMGIYMNPGLMKGVSAGLQKRMQGKSCFNFKSVDTELFTELEALTRASIDGMREHGFVIEEER